MTTAEPTEQRGPLRWVDGTMPALQERVLHIPVVGFIEYCLRGVGQVVFMNSPITGLLIAAWITDPWFGFAGTIAVITSTLAGIALGFDRGAIHAGLYGFNGVLVGLGLALFLDPPWDVLVIVWIIVLSALSSVLMGALAAVFGGAWGVPPFTLAFNITTLLFLVTALNIAFGRLSALVEPALPAVNGPGVSVSLRETADATGNTDAMAILNAIFRGIGQLFFLNSILAGVLIIIGIAFCSGSPPASPSSARLSECSPACTRRRRRGDLQRAVGVQLVRRGAGDRRGVLRVDLALGVVGRRLCGVRRIALRRHSLDLRALGAARPDAALLLWNASLRAPEGRVEALHMGATR
jgi:hypothetical protein